MRFSLSGLPPEAATSRRVGVGAVVVMASSLYHGRTGRGKAPCPRPSYTQWMKRVQLSELGALAEDVRKGETIDVIDGERVVAKVLPLDEARLEAQIQDLARRGLARLVSGRSLPEDFFT